MTVKILMFFCFVAIQIQLMNADHLNHYPRNGYSSDKRESHPLPRDEDDNLYSESEEYDDEYDYYSESKDKYYTQPSMTKDPIVTSTTLKLQETTPYWKMIETTKKTQKETTSIVEDEATAQARWTTRDYIPNKGDPTVNAKKFTLKDLMKFSTLDEAVQTGIWITIIVVTVFVICFICCIIASCTGSEPKKYDQGPLYI